MEDTKGRREKGSRTYKKIELKFADAFLEK